MRIQRNHQRERAIADMRASGMSLAQIAERMGGVSRQAIHKVCQRVKREAGASKTTVDPPAPQA